MSHWTQCRVDIKNPDLVILKKAISVVASELGSQLKENFLVEGWGYSKKCRFAIPLRLPYGNGFGINIENGQIKIYVDDHGAPLSSEEFAQKLTQYYVALAVAEIAKKNNRSIKIQQTPNGIIIDVFR